MPKVNYLHSQEDALRELLFGTEMQPVNLSRLSARTDIPVTTLSANKRHPRGMRADNLLRIAKVRNVSIDALAAIIRQWR